MARYNYWWSQIYRYRQWNFKKNSYIDKHGHIKTNYISDNKKQSKITGILITGDSVTEGWPLTIMGMNNSSFVNQLEYKLRLQDKSIDLINLARNGYNSWQENVEVARYFNSELFHDDLPSNIELIASVGGNRDFHGFVSLLMNFEDNQEYYNANGLMAWRLKEYSSTSDKYTNEVAESLSGSIDTTFKIFFSSLIRYIKKESNIYHFLYLVKKEIKNKLQPKANTVIISKTDSLGNKGVPLTLNEIIEKKLFINFDKYKKVRNIVVQSVSRNLNSMRNLQPNKKFVFIYLPTKYMH